MDSSVDISRLWWGCKKQSTLSLRAGPVCLPYIDDPLSEAVIQGSLPRPAELEIYLGDTGIFCRQIKAAGEEGELVGAGTEVAGTPLYTF